MNCNFSEKIKIDQEQYKVNVANSRSFKQINVSTRIVDDFAVDHIWNEDRVRPVAVELF